MAAQKFLTLSLIVIGVLVSHRSSATESAPPALVRYAKITGTFLNFQSGQRIPTGIQYSSQELKSGEHDVVIRTYENGKIIETHAALVAPDFLSFSSKSDDPRIPVITGRFLNLDYEESILNASLPDQKFNIAGAVTKLSDSSSISIKTLTDSSTGKVIAIMQERMDFISESEFKSATNQK
jgi:hypothetical protein